MASAFFSFLHFVAVLGIAGVLFFQFFTFSRVPTLDEARRIQRADLWYGLCAGVLLVVGFLRVYFFEKGAAFYFKNPFFHMKLGLFVLLGLLSIYPTMQFLSWRRELRAGKTPPPLDAPVARRIRLILHAELAILALIVLAATLMAKGVGS